MAQRGKFEYIAELCYHEKEITGINEYEKISPASQVPGMFMKGMRKVE